MIIKRISCKVKEGYKDLFYEYQKHWGPLGRLNGFLGQVGGWKEPLTACIYTFWESKQDYQHFMEEVHDEIYVNSGQESTYSSINVTLYQEKLKIDGLDHNFINILTKADFFRVSLSMVKEDEKKHFVDMQKKVWNVGLQQADGMLGGTFALSQKENNNFLVLTGWENEKYHQGYMDKQFPKLITTAKPMNDVLELKGEKFLVEEAWRVVPTVIK